MRNRSRLAFVTIGQTPRVDIVPEMLAEIGGDVEAVEFGVLDGLTSSQREAFAAAPGDASFATRLNDGTEFTCSKARIEDRLNELLHEIDGQGFDAIVLLCTGTRIDPLERTLVVEAQRIVDSTVEALAASCRNLGVILPLERQVAEFADRHVFSFAPKLVSASPYAGDRIGERAAQLKGCELTIMHCMGYTAAMLDEAKGAIGGPVLLSRRLVANVVRQLV